MATERTDERAEEKRPKPLKVTRSDRFMRVHADTVIVDNVADELVLVFMTRGLGVTEVIWPDDFSQPSHVRMSPELEEQVCVRLSPEAMNDLALNIILEASSVSEVDLEAFDANIKIVRESLVNRLKEFNDGE